MKLLLMVVAVCAILVAFSMAVKIGAEPTDILSKLGLLFFGTIGAINLHFYITLDV